ncbi:uncharacterized protein LOC130648656 [Hydractinia symbiolongicarpus]|uniref:uncharacterized protein LOC130648656 n=1 Tax=Hydractinia symbiolongicarpus TaxID=13093 RepID=UPI00255056E4|nr:uncharacterized protein LOC130648656 [Hydractinia symbiolongicarpus]
MSRKQILNFFCLSSSKFKPTIQYIMSRVVASSYQVLLNTSIAVVLIQLYLDDLIETGHYKLYSPCIIIYCLVCILSFCGLFIIWTFRIPENGCFDDKAVLEFQLKLLRKELYNAKKDLLSAEEKLHENREILKIKSYRIIPSIIFHTRLEIRQFRSTHADTLNKKLNKLSDEQGKPLFNVTNTVICYELTERLPKYVMETLALGPRNPIIEKFNKNDVLTGLDDLIRFCKDKKINDELITDINVKTLAYVKKCNKQKPSKNIQMTKKYLKLNNLIAVPFDKGIGICVMKVESYNNKMNDIIGLPQFNKLTSKRKNEKNPVFKEEERITSVLKELKVKGKISEQLYDKLKPIGSQPPRIYGLAKVHKNNTPMRPVLSMPGSPYYKLANQVAKWLSVVDECNINSSTKQISDLITHLQLAENEELSCITQSRSSAPTANALPQGHQLVGLNDKQETSTDLRKAVTCAGEFLFAKDLQ